MNDPVFEFEIAAGGGPPAGNYKAEFQGVEKTVHESYGDGLRWSWKVTDGPQAGVIASRTTSPRPTTGNAAGKLLASMTGGAIAAGVRLSIRDLVGRQFLINVAQSQSGATRVDTAIPL